MMKYLQKLGKALMLPVAVLPICGIRKSVQLIPSASCWSRQAAL